MSCFEGSDFFWFPIEQFRLLVLAAVGTFSVESPPNNDHFSSLSAIKL